MHKVEIRLTNEGQADAANVFELYTERLLEGDKGYVESGPMQSVPGGGAAIVMFLDVNERVIIVAKGNKGRLSFDKEQNANVRVETETEVAERKEREERAAKHQADQAVGSAEAKVAEAQQSAQQAEKDALGGVKKAEADRAKIEADQAKNRAAASEAMPRSGTATTTAAPPPAGQTARAPVGGPSPTMPGNPASANTGPIDSKQIKAERDAPASSSEK